MAPQPFLALITPLTGEPGVPAHPIVTPPPGVPTHPIATPPPGIWGPTDPRPTPPIYWPPNLGIWGPNDPRPDNPIVIPPEPPAEEVPPTGPLGKMNWGTVWSEQTGWAVIGVPADAHVTPSKRR